MKKLWLLILAIPMTAFAAQPMTAPPTSHPKSHFALLPGRHQLILNVTRWTAFRIKSDLPITVYEKGCKQNPMGVTDTVFVCNTDADITVTDDRPIVAFWEPPNVVRITWISTGNNPISVGDLMKGSHSP